MTTSDDDVSLGPDDGQAGPPLSLTSALGRPRLPPGNLPGPQWGASRCPKGVGRPLSPPLSLHNALQLRATGEVATPVLQRRRRGTEILSLPRVTQLVAEVSLRQCVCGFPGQEKGHGCLRGHAGSWDCRGRSPEGGTQTSPWRDRGSQEEVASGTGGSGPARPPVA